MWYGTKKYGKSLVVAGLKSQGSTQSSYNVHVRAEKLLLWKWPLALLWVRKVGVKVDGDAESSPATAREARTSRTQAALVPALKIPNGVG